jgi:multiple sugar transport system substrate-binding protein
VSPRRSPRQQIKRGRPGAGAVSRRALLALLPAAGAGAGCAWPGAGGASRGVQDGSGAGAPPRPGQPPATLEFWGGPNGAQRQDQVGAWNGAHPEAQVRFSAVPAVGQGTEALRALAAAVAAGKAPQVLDFDRFQVASFANWGVFRALDDLLKRDRVDLARFAPVALEEAYGLDGRLYGLPSSVDDRLLYWNKDRFAEAGLDPERPPSTWDELATAALQTTRRDGAGALDRLGLDVGQDQATLHLFAWQNGGAFQSPDGKRATLPLPANAGALLWMADLLRAQGGAEATRRLRQRWPAADGPQHPFLSGELAMQYQLPDWAGSVLARYRPETPFGVAPPPRRGQRGQGDEVLTWSGGYSYVVGRDAPHPAPAWAFVLWLTGEAGWRVAFDGERERARAAGGVFVPGMTGQPALDARFLEQYRPGLPALDAVLELARALLPRARVRERSIAAAELWDGVLGAQAEVLAEQAPPPEALERRNGTVQRALDQAWVFAPRGGAR